MLRTTALALYCTIPAPQHQITQIMKVHKDAAILAFQVNTDKIMKSPLDYKHLAVALLAQKLITLFAYKEVLDTTHPGRTNYLRLGELIRHASRDIKTDPINFERFLNAIEKISVPGRDIALQLKISYNEELRKFQPERGIVINLHITRMLLSALSIIIMLVRNSIIFVLL